VAGLFMDTSALVRRYDPEERGSASVEALCSRDAGHVVFTARLTGLEVASAFNRKLREGRFDADRLEHVWALFIAHWHEQYRVVGLDEPVFARAEQLLFSYPLRAYDALQLACGLRVAGLLSDLQRDLRFCTADRTQARAAAAEGLEVEYIA